ncbi:MAG: BON domain-containing protein [Gemmatimonadaceae bacterium]
MSPFRYRDEESSATGALYVALGALAGFAAGVVVAQQYGGLSGLTSRLKDRLGGITGDAAMGDSEPSLDAHAFDDGYDDEADDEPLEPTEELEERVLEAFRNDPVLSERAVDIGAIDDGIVELTGWVNSESEADHAVVVTRGTPGVETVVNRLAIRSEEELLQETADRYENGDAALTEGHWEGQNIGTGRSRQGSSADIDRHDDPRVELEESVLDQVFLDTDDEGETKAERRARTKQSPKRGRSDGSPLAPGGVPKSDHVANPLDAPTDVVPDE